MPNPFAYGSRITDPARFPLRYVIEKTDRGYRLASPIMGMWVRERAL